MAKQAEKRSVFHAPEIKADFRAPFGNESDPRGIRNVRGRNSPQCQSSFSALLKMVQKGTSQVTLLSLPQNP